MPTFQQRLTEEINETLTIPHDQFDPRWRRPRIHRLSHPKQIILVPKTVGSNWYDFINNGDKKWEQEQDPLKTKIQQKMIASAGSPTVTSRSLNLVSIFSSQSRGHFSNIFVEVFGNALIFIFYLSIGPDASASARRSFVARLVKIVSFFLRWLMGEESESVKKTKRWFKETTEWAEEVYQ